MSILTGDTRDRALAAGFVDAETGLSPEDKRARILARRAQGLHTLFIGDGINDAPSLAASHAAIALENGAEIAVEAASATLYGGDLSAIPWSIALARNRPRRPIEHPPRRLLQRRWDDPRRVRPASSDRCVAPHGRLQFAHRLRAARVGRAVDCGCFETMETEHRPSKQEVAIRVLGSCSLLAQGPILAMLAGLGRMGFAVVVASFAALAAVFAWSGSPKRSRAASMLVGMISFGNFGMLLGWWFDAGFRPVLRCGCGFDPSSFVHSAGMWLGMLIGCNLATAWMGRGDAPSGLKWIELIFSNIGMIVGMALGGALVDRRLGSGMPALTVFVGFGAMTSGMVLGMWIGHHLACLLKPFLRRASRAIDATSSLYGLALPNGFVRRGESTLYSRLDTRNRSLSHCESATAGPARVFDTLSTQRALFVRSSQLQCSPTLSSRQWLRSARRIDLVFALGDSVFFLFPLEEAGRRPDEDLREICSTR